MRLTEQIGERTPHSGGDGKLHLTEDGLGDLVGDGADRALAGYAAQLEVPSSPREIAFRALIKTTTRRSRGRDNSRPLAGGDLRRRSSLPTFSVAPIPPAGVYSRRGKQWITNPYCTPGIRLTARKAWTEKWMWFLLAGPPTLRPHTEQPDARLRACSRWRKDF